MNTLTRNFIALLLFVPFLLFGEQDYTFWNQVHNWDGKTPWTQYLKYSSKYMGPNALPVPNNIGGKAGDSTFIEINSAYHYYTGDQTRAWGYNVNFNLMKDKVSLSINGVGQEFYHMDTFTRDERASRNINLSGRAWGDVNINVIWQIMKQPSFLDLALRINLKTASGQKMEEARYTDGPAYYFDLSAGKNFKTKFDILPLIRLKAYAGFYCWQTMITQQRQSDAVMYSVGTDFLIRKNLWILNEYSGYYGSLYTGDQPMIFKSTLHYKFRKTGVYLEYYKGFNDYLYQSFRLGLQVQIGN